MGLTCHVDFKHTQTCQVMGSPFGVLTGWGSRLYSLVGGIKPCSGDNYTVYCLPCCTNNLPASGKSQEFKYCLNVTDCFTSGELCMWTQYVNSALITAHMFTDCNIYTVCINRNKYTVVTIKCQNYSILWFRLLSSSKINMFYLVNLTELRWVQQFICT